MLRGVALLGILTMNINGMALPGQAGLEEPTIAGGDTGLNLVAWFSNELFFSGKMRTLFSMLFGAGLILMTARSESKAGATPLADIYYRRNIWLIVFGLIHGYILLWPGDILYGYGLCALFLFTFRNTTAKRLIMASLCAFAILVFVSLYDWRVIHGQHAEAAATGVILADGGTLTEEQKAAKETWEEKLESFKPGEKKIEEEIATMRGGYWGIFKHLSGKTASLESVMFYRIWFWDVIGMMLLGMAMMKMGIFTAGRSYRFYIWMIAIGYGIGNPLNAGVSYYKISQGFDPVMIHMTWMIYNLQRLTVAIGYVGLVMLICKSGAVQWLTARLAAVGRMALTNYISQTILCTLVFYGYGLGLFARLERHQIVLVVVGIWIFQLIVSPIWLRHFRFGPLEWIWRKLKHRPLEKLPLPAATEHPGEG